MDKKYRQEFLKENPPDIRERMGRSGPSTVANYELMAALLGTGSRNKDVRTLASEVLEVFDFSKAVPGIEALSKLPGLGKARACRIAAALELGRRFYGHRGRHITGPVDVWHLVRHFDDRQKERFLCICLNGAHEVSAVRVVSVGLANRAIVHPREVFAEAIETRSCAIIVAHNHPSGRMEPSAEDIDITERLRRAGEILGISLVDHIIFSQDKWLSMVEAGLLKRLAVG